MGTTENMANCWANRPSPAFCWHCLMAETFWRSISPVDFYTFPLSFTCMPATEARRLALQEANINLVLPFTVTSPFLKLLLAAILNKDTCTLLLCYKEICTWTSRIFLVRLQKTWPRLGLGNYLQLVETFRITGLRRTSGYDWKTLLGTLSFTSSITYNLQQIMQLNSCI